jgi:hypothetical protein
VTPRGFGTQYCAWHSQTTGNGQPLPYTNLPYISDAGGQGASAIIPVGGTNYAVQSLFSNNFNNNAGGCVNRYVSAIDQG